jgi:hypothetical protein
MSLGRRDRGHGLARHGPERAAGSRQDDLLNAFGVLEVEDLIDRAVLGIDRQQGGAITRDLRQDERAGADERLLVGERHHRAAANCGKRRFESGSADDRGHDPLGRPAAGLGNGRSPRRGLDPAAAQRLLELEVFAGIADHRAAGAQLAGLFGQQLDVAIGRERFDLEGAGVATDQIDGVAAD